ARRRHHRPRRGHRHDAGGRSTLPGHRPAGAAVRRLAFLALVGCSAGLPAPGPAPAASAPRRGGTLRVSVVDDVRTLDPARAYDEFSTMAVHLVHDTLVGYAPAEAPDPTALVPQLAESWSISDDGLTYRFTLRAGAAFSDGAPVEAADFVAALDRVRSPEVASPGAFLYTGIEGLLALDARHLEIRVAERDPSFLLRLAMVFAAPWREGAS